MFGGALWGAATSLYKRLPTSQVLSATIRTSLVTGLVPAYFVGFCVSLFDYFHHRADTETDIHRLYSSSLFLTLYPWYYLLPIVERYAPLWLGGHIVGFSSFFLYMLYTDSDLLKTEQMLDEQDRKRQLRERKLAILEARLRAEEAAKAKAEAGTEGKK
eukprot:TRINITY_DN8498_c0_g1_i2.p1 TRINITY_DN8498_c0_g1~~TRINITY_DN8498_c0_g1_i2.p1  ORF type:complete len:159 (-),score=31.73 TRINITY_DN8498_c0_g1_i2:72-548(-)